MKKKRKGNLRVLASSIETVEIGAHEDGTTGFLYLDRGYRDRGPRGMEKNVIHP